MQKITLYGFNNLTKSLSFSLYKLHYIVEPNCHDQYNDYIAKTYSARKLNIILTKICHAIGGNVLNAAWQDYQPQGASVTLMISEEAAPTPLQQTENLGSLVAHIDKSHLCIHTYPEEVPQAGIAIFRADIELSTCGVISPLNILNFVINTFDADVIDIDYRIRGMTRDADGKKLFNLDKINNISDFLSPQVCNNFHLKEHSFTRQNLFHSQLARKEINLDTRLFQMTPNHLTQQDELAITKKLTAQIQQLFKKTH